MGCCGVAGAPFWDWFGRGENRRRGCGNVGIAQRFPRALGNEGNLLLVFLVFHRASFPQPAPCFSARRFRAHETRKQFPLGLLHLPRRRGVAFGFGDALQSLDRLSRLEIFGGLGQLLERFPRGLVVAIQPLLLAFGVVVNSGCPQGRWKFK